MIQKGWKTEEKDQIQQKPPSSPSVLKAVCWGDALAAWSKSQFTRRKAWHQFRTVHLVVPNMKSETHVLFACGVSARLAGCADSFSLRRGSSLAGFSSLLKRFFLLSVGAQPNGWQRWICFPTAHLLWQLQLHLKGESQNHPDQHCWLGKKNVL